MDLTDPTSVALEIAEALRSEGVGHALYRGLLLAAYRDPLETKDADLAVVRADATFLSTRELEREDASSVLRTLGSDLDTDLLEREIDGLANRIGSHPVRERWDRIRGRS